MFLIWGGVYKMYHQLVNETKYRELGNVYQISILSPDGVHKWKRIERRAGYDIRADYKEQRKLVSEVQSYLLQGDVNPIVFQEKMKNIYQNKNGNFERFVVEFPKFWNGLSPEKKIQYLKGQD